MVEPPSRFLANDPPFDPGKQSPFDEGVLYLLSFSERVFDLVPDGLAVLDERLVLRSANAAFLELANLGAIERARGSSLGAHPLLAARVDVQGASMPLADFLRDQLSSGAALASGNLLARGEDSTAYEVRSLPWDDSDPRSRRLLLWIRRVPEAPAAPNSTDVVPAALLEEKNDRYFALRAFTDRLLEILPVGICLLDPSLRVVTDGAWMRERIGRRSLSESVADRHLFALYPDLRGSELQHALEECRQHATPARFETGVFVDGAIRRLAIEVHAFLPEGTLRGVLLLVRELDSVVESAAAPASVPAAAPESVQAEAPAPSAKAVSAPIRTTPAPEVAAPRLLLVERAGPQRAALSDRLRTNGFDDVVVAASGTDAIVRQNPADFSLVVIGFEPWDQEVVDFARRVAEEAPRVPIFVVSSAHLRDVERFFGDVPLRRVLPREGPPNDLPRAVREILALPEPPAESPSTLRTRSVILVGARESDVPVLRLLYRAPGIVLRMLYDPDPEAPGLVLGRSLGIPALSGTLELSLESPPDAIILAREGLDSAVEQLGLGSLPRITRDEIELFLVDPDTFLESEARDVEVELDSLAASRTVPAAPIEVPPPLAPLAPLALETNHPRFFPAAPSPAAKPPDGTRFTPSPSLSISSTPRGEDVHSEVETMLRALDLLLDFQRFSDWLLETALRLTDGASGSLMLLQEEKPVLAIVASRGLKDIASRHRRQRVGEGISGRVAEDGEPLLLIGTAGDPNLKPMGLRPEIRSSVVVPILAEESVVGVLNLNSDPSLSPFDEHTLERAAHFGRQCGGALSRSLQLRKMRGRSFEQSMRGEIATIAAAPGDLSGKLRQIADRLAKVLAADSCTIYLLDHERKFLDLAAAAGVSAGNVEAIRVPIGTGVVGWVAKNRRPLVMRNPEEEVGDPQPTNLAFPIRYQTDLLGVLALEAAHPIAMEEDRLALVDSIAASIGVIIAEARLSEDSTKMVTMLSALSELGLAFSAATHPKGLARLVAFTAATVLESEVGLVRLRRAEAPGSDDPADFELLASHGASVPLETEPLGQLEEILVARALRSGEPCRDIDLPLSEAESLLRQCNVSAAIAIPITTSSRELLGALTVCRVVGGGAQHTYYGDSEVEIASRLGDYAAAAAAKFLSTSDQGDDAEEGGEFD